MQSISHVLAIGTLLVCGCQLTPIELARHYSTSAPFDDVELGERYIFFIEPDESGASFQYAGEVAEMNDREVVLKDATVDVHLESSNSMFQKLFGDNDPVATRHSKKKLIVEKDRVRTVLPEAGSNTPL
jgi:hypothetical protein